MPSGYYAASCSDGTLPLVLSESRGICCIHWCVRDMTLLAPCLYSCLKTIWASTRVFNEYGDTTTTLFILCLFTGGAGVTADARFRPWKESQYVAASWVVGNKRKPEVMVRCGGLLWGGKTNGEAAVVLKNGEMPHLRFSTSRKLWRGVQGQTSCTLGKGEKKIGWF